MDTSVPAAVAPTPGFSRFRKLGNPGAVAALFCGLIACQALGYLILGTGRAGMGVSETILVLQNLLALACTWIAFRRAHGTAALFWFLFGAFLVFLLLPNVLISYGTAFNHAIVPTETWRVLYCLYGAPILMMLFLPAADRAHRLKSEVFLDLFQVAIVVALAFTSFFYLPVQQMLPSEAMRRNLNVSNLLSIFLLVAVFVRLRFTRTPAARDLVQRIAIFLLVSGVITFIGNWIDLHQYATASAWWYLGWALCYITPGMVAITWFPSADFQPASEPDHFLSFLGKNVVLVAILFSIDQAVDKWKEGHGSPLTNIVIGATLVAFTIRLALTQFHQQQEIAQRQAAEAELFVANKTISGLLEHARIETSAITRINELGSLLQACASRDEAFRAIPERLARLFPGTSGALSVLNTSRIRAESVAEWGIHPPLHHAPAERGSLGAGSTPASTDQASALPSHPLQPGGASVFAPLIANREALGVLAIRDDAQPSDASSPSPAYELSHRQQMASSVAEQIALTISNLDLREALRARATHDPLTGLYNRRYMQEFLEREIHRARRRERPLAVMLLDIDHFKRYNDTYGHPAGDEALRFVAETLLSSVRAEDLACRYGGEEFVVLLPECSLEKAAVRAEEIRTRLKQLYEERAGELPQVVTASIGVAAFPEITDQVDLLLKCADEALYQAKHAGRDRVVIAKPAQAASAG